MIPALRELTLWWRRQTTENGKDIELEKGYNEGVRKCLKRVGSELHFDTLRVFQGMKGAHTQRLKDPVRI